MNYYQLVFKEEEFIDLATTKNEINTPDNPDYKKIISGGRFDNWNTVDFIIDKGSFVDYQANIEYWHLCSNKMKSIIDSLKHKDDDIQWLSVKLFNSYGDNKDYYALHLVKQLNILDEAKTRFAGKAKNIVIKPHLKQANIANSKVFTFDKSLGVAVILSEDIKDALNNVKCIGIDFIKLDTT